MIDFIKDADCTKDTPVRLGVPDAPIYGKGIKLKPRVDGRTDSEHFKKIYLPELLPLEEYDLIVVLISGGKDSVACYLKLLELGVPKERIEFWHHDIDGGHPSRRMDWKCTQNYVKALADAEGIKLRVSYRVNGFFGELYRIGASEPIEWIDHDTGEVRQCKLSSNYLKCKELKEQATEEMEELLKQYGYRMKFPAKTGDLSRRWCSAYLKICVADTVVSNLDRLGELEELGGKRHKFPAKGGTHSGRWCSGNGIQIVSYRGEENFWGNIWWWIDGINHYANATTGECDTYVADHGFTDDSKAAPYEDTGMCAKYGNGYISAFCYSEDFDWLFLPGEFNGNTALPVGDYCWNQNGTGWRVAILGAGWGDGLYAGAFFWYLDNASSNRYRYIGGRLVYRKKVAA